MPSDGFVSHPEADVYRDGDDVVVLAYSIEAQDRIHEWLDEHDYAWHHPESNTVPDGVRVRDGDAIEGDPRVFIVTEGVDPDAE